jgi:GT2 family glycosyltransferase/tetratricopeptide (TPR) repeat protein
MSRKYLFGPVSAEFADQHLAGPRRAGDCLAFGPGEGLDVTAGPSDSWDDVCGRLPSGWRPDFVALYLAYACVPRWAWSAPVPLVGLAADWNLLFHAYRHALPRCDLALTDVPGVEALARSGITHAGPANLYGLGRDFLEDLPPSEQPRDIDVLFVGNLHPAVQRGRLPWLGRLARLAGRRRVALACGVFGPEYRALLARARVAFNRSVRGECNQRAFEAVAGGALLFQEAGNCEVPDFLRDRQECVLYGDDDLEDLLEQYLDDEPERHRIAGAARQRVGEFAYEALWGRALQAVEQEWPALLERARSRSRPSPADELLARTWQAVSSHAPDDPDLPRDLEAALGASVRSGDAPRKRAAALSHALGLLCGLRLRRPGAAAVAREAAGHFRRALDLDPTHPVAAVSLVEALAASGEPAQAVAQARTALPPLDRRESLDPASLDAAPFPPGFDLVRVEWERAAWQNAGDPAAEARAKRELLRWRLHSLLADLTGELSHYHEAALARPDLPSARAALGCALGRAGRVVEAVPHLARATEGNPFDATAARALYQALTDGGDAEGARRLARDRRLLHKAAPDVVREEPWFAQAPPAGDGLASVIILCHNQLEYTRPCLESVLAYTRSPYELVLIDNASTDGTPEYLEGLRSRDGPARVEVIRNGANVGFPAGCNQGLARARGEYLVFLNNDTVVTEGWLDGLVRWSLHEYPSVGLVGAVTNASRPPQEIAVDYPGLDGLPAFAARRRQEYAGQALEAERLTGFCLLARREVLDRVGGFDESFGLGFFDDDDLCVRARRAGFKLLVALDVFVHHFGSRTFAALGLDCRRQLEENLARFRDKWGDDEAKGYRLPGQEGPGADAPAPVPAESVPAAPASRPMRVSLCMIVKDEEANLADCLTPVLDLVDEAVIADTGSTDRTKEVAASFGAKVKLVDFPWVDSFSAARNESLRHATGDWALWVDADDRLDEGNREKLRSLFASLRDENAAYVMRCLCLPDPQTRVSTEVTHVRLFRSRPDVRFEHRVHEQVLPALRRCGADVRWSDVVIRHTGYADPALRGRKLQRDLRLLELERAEQPEHPFTLFNLGSVRLELGQAAEALLLFRRSLELSRVSDSIVRKLYSLVAACHRQLGQPAEALAACREGREHYPNDAELLFAEASLRQEAGDLISAAACLERLLAGSEAEHFRSVADGLRGYRARHNLAVLHRDLGRPDRAAEQWRLAVEERPDFVPAWVGLGELAVADGRWDEAEGVAARLEGELGAQTEGAVLRGQGHLARKEFAEARTALEGAVARWPQAVWPRIILTHVLLQEGRDWAAAERALRGVLELDPGNAQARQNLEVLLRQQGRAAG